LKTFEWSDLFETGLAEVDAQHQRLVELVNALGDEITGARAEHIDRVLGDLAQYTVYHFACEEALMQAAGLDARHVAAHCATHQRFVAQVTHWMQTREAAGQLSAAQLLDYLANWLVFHILGEDQSMGRQVLAVRTGTAPDVAFEGDSPSDDPRTAILLHALRRLYVDLVERNELLVAARDNLTQLNASLELRVDQRTSELAAANQRLREEQEKAIETEKMASLGRLVAGFAHEVNTPVGIAVGAVSQVVDAVAAFGKLMQCDEVSEAQVADLTGLMNEASALALSNLQRAASLVSSFKRTAVDQTSERQRNYGLCELIDDVLASLGPLFRHTAVTLSCQCPADLQLHGVPGVLTQVLTNLCTNALDHAFAGGSRVGVVQISASREADEVVLNFVDNGAGIETQHLAKIFEPFFTTNRQRGGSGLGLYIAYNLVTQSLGGSIACQSEKGQGTAFCIRFPYIAAQPAEEVS
jgi:hemerythrin-like metal-binding protein